jgi:hypothetical protein
MNLLACLDIEHMACQPFSIHCLCPLIRRLYIEPTLADAPSQISHLQPFALPKWVMAVLEPRSRQPQQGSRVSRSIAPLLPLLHNSNTPSPQSSILTRSTESQKVLLTRLFLNPFRVDCLKHLFPGLKPRPRKAYVAVKLSDYAGPQTRARRSVAKEVWAKSYCRFAAVFVPNGRYLSAIRTGQ